ncbi:TPA: hypothetical protein HA265_03240 [Candidatus Woesearchaeota archaeon]|nr:hypothetical protein [Candidatus Woesearchaeota archaeon]
MSWKTANQYVVPAAFLAAVAVPSCYVGMKMEECGAGQERNSYTYHLQQGRVLPEDLHYQTWRDWHAVSGKGKMSGVQCVYWHDKGHKGVRCEVGDRMYNLGRDGNGGGLLEEFRNVNRGGQSKQWTRVRQKRF